MRTLSLTARVYLAEVAAWARARQIIAAAVLTGRSADDVARIWAASPANWCDRPGCPRCWGRWGRS